MPEKKPTPGESPSEDLVLAAIDRAYRHRRNTDNPGVLFVDLKEHLGLPRSGSATLRLRPTWETLHADGLIEQSRQSNRVIWRLTEDGHKRIQAARRTSQLPLPESPQHRTWREAHAAAGQRIDSLLGDLRIALSGATSALEASFLADSHD